MKIRKNMGTADRVVRIVAGAVLLALALTAAGGRLPGWAMLGLVGVVPLVAGIIGNCPTYALLGINTRPERKRHAAETGRGGARAACC